MTASFLTRNPHTAILTGAGMLLILVLCAGAKYCLAAGLAWQCPVLTWLGLPCPSCGSTRAFAALSELRLMTAVSFNPLVILGVPAVIAAIRFRHRLAHSSLAWPVFFAAVLLNWLYLLVFLPR